MKYLAAILMVLILVGSSGAQETCDGSQSLTVDRGKGFVLCWDKNPEPDVTEYRVYLDGDLFSTYMSGDCGLFICETGKLVQQAMGSFSLTVKAYDGTNESEASNPVTLVVEDKAPSKPTGCSIRMF